MKFYTCNTAVHGICHSSFVYLGEHIFCIYIYLNNIGTMNKNVLNIEVAAAAKVDSTESDR